MPMIEMQSWQIEDDEQINSTAAKMVKKLQKQEQRMTPTERRQLLKMTTEQRLEEAKRQEMDLSNNSIKVKNYE